jgi:hypothetical protein
MPTRSSGLGAAATRKTRPVAAVPDDDTGRPVKWTAVLDQVTVTRFERVTDSMRRVGRLAAGRYPSRADVLRAVVALVDDDPELAERVAGRITADLTTRARR